MIVHRVSLLVFSSLLALLSPSQDASSSVRSLREIRFEGLIPQRWDTSCGAATLATVLTYEFNHPVSERTVVSGLLRQTEPVKVRHRGGFSLLDMKRYANELGFNAVGMKGLSYEQLLAYGSPIVPIKVAGFNHYVVVKGLDERGRILLGDPAFGNITYTRKKFEKVWIEQMAFIVSDQEIKQ